jgi:hypothetical protein
MRMMKNSEEILLSSKELPRRDSCRILQALTTQSWRMAKYCRIRRQNKMLIEEATIQPLYI